MVGCAVSSAHDVDLSLRSTLIPTPGWFSVQHQLPLLIARRVGTVAYLADLPFSAWPLSLRPARRALLAGSITSPSAGLIDRHIATVVYALSV